VSFKTSTKQIGMNWNWLRRGWQNISGR